jgi:hypothetical protein
MTNNHPRSSVSMKYDIFFHDDLDGRASAAVILDFLRSRGDNAQRFIPLDYTIKPQWGKLNFFEVNKLIKGKRNPSIVLDFRYHPKATFWFDHHPTTFLTKNWEKNFRPSKFHNFDPKAPSCCGQVMHSLVKNFSYKPPRHIKELVHWLDIIDGGNFKSARQTIDIKEPAIQIDAFIENETHGSKSLAWLIELLSTKPLNRIASDSRVKSAVTKMKITRKQSLEFYRSKLQIYEKGVLSIDLSRLKTDELRFAPFYLQPKSRYAVILKKSRGYYHFTVSVNPWQRKKSKVHIGQLLTKYGGGGHKNVGGLETKTRQNADRIANELIEYLKKR